MKPSDTIRTLANAYSFSLHGLADEDCYNVEVDHERCEALRKHFDRYAQDFETTRVAEKLLLSRAGWNEAAVSEILDGAGSRAVLRRVAWLSEFSQTRWWRPDFSESTRQEMCQELKSMRVVQQVENVTEVVPEHCIPNLVDPSDTVPQSIVDAYHRDLMDIILSAPNHEQSEIAALSLGELTSMDKSALLPVLQWNDPFRRTLASGLLLREGMTDGTLVAPLLHAYFRETNAEIRLAMQLYLEIIEKTGGMSLRHFSEEAQRATLQELSIAVAENDAAVQLDVIELLHRLHHRFDESQYAELISILLTAAHATDLSVQTKALKSLALLSLDADHNFTKNNPEQRAQIDQVLTHALENGNEGTRRALAAVLAQSAHLIPETHLRNALATAAEQDSHLEVRANTLRALSNCGTLKQEQAHRAISNTQPIIRRAGMYAIGTLRKNYGIFALKALAAGIADRDHEVQLEALLQLVPYDVASLERFQQGLSKKRKDLLFQAIDHAKNTQNDALLDRLLQAIDDLKLEEEQISTL